LLLGEEGAMLLPHYDEAILLPDEKYKDHPRPAVSPKTHYNEWVNACLGEEHADANFDYSGPLTEAILLGNVAVRVKEKTLEWDAPGMRFPNAPEADALLRRGYREGWHIEGLG
ncbi:MAG: hypothetical protein QG656_660, partial [Candidatus Hydrogenedentes bacterium]|nr:hypothetical protein [Candidatus Hydrogenedentota bacterium]